MLYPWLPFELVEAIVAETWFMPLTSRERVAFMTSAPLVSRAWLAIYSHISRRNVHIPSPSYLDRFLAMLSKDYPLDLCQSIAFSTDTLHRHPYSLNKPLINLLYTISLFRLPNLHTFSLVYATPYPDEFLIDLADTFDFAPFPPQITSLQLTLADPEHTSDPWTLISSLPCHPSTAHRRRLSWPLPSVNHLTIRGATELAIVNLVSACPNLSILSIDSTAVAGLDNTCPCDRDALLLFSDGAPGSGTRLSIKLHSYGSEAEYWDGIETSRWNGLSVFHRCGMTQEDIPLTFAHA